MPSSRILCLVVFGCVFACVIGCQGESEAPETPSDPAAETASANGPAGAENESSSGGDENAAADTGDAANSAGMYSPEAFRMAAHDGKLRVVQICLNEKLDVNEASPQGHTPLTMAAYNGHTEIVKLLIDNGAEVDPRDLEGKTPLMHASSGSPDNPGFAKTVKVLLDAGAEINAVDAGERFTALMTAAALGNIEVVKALVEAGADASMVDIDGESAADFARDRGFPQIAALLEKK